MARRNMGSDRRRSRRATLVRVYGEECSRCGDKNDLTIDHIIPLARGGRNALENLQLLCYACNQAKGYGRTDYRAHVFTAA